MSEQQRKHYLVEHIWRALRASLLFAAVVVWLYTVHTEWVILTLCFLAHMTEQFHGKICNLIEKLLGWDPDFDEWD